MANCILIAGGIDHDNTVPRIHRTLGSYRIASAVESKGYTTFVLDFAINFTPEEICQALAPHLTKDTLWVGFSSTFYFTNNRINEEHGRKNEMYYAPYDQAKIVIDFIRKHSNAKLIYGGTKAAFYRDDPFIDYYVMGYADNSVIAVTDYIAGKTSIDPGRIVNSIDYPEPAMDSIQTSWKNHNVLYGEA